MRVSPCVRGGENASEKTTRLLHRDPSCEPLFRDHSRVFLSHVTTVAGRGGIRRIFRCPSTSAPPRLVSPGAPSCPSSSSLAPPTSSLTDCPAPCARPPAYLSASVSVPASTIIRRKASAPEGLTSTRPSSPRV